MGKDDLLIPPEVVISPPRAALRANSAASNTTEGGRSFLTDSSGSLSAIHPTGFNTSVTQKGIRMEQTEEGAVELTASSGQYLQTKLIRRKTKQGQAVLKLRSQAAKTQRLKEQVIAAQNCLNQDEKCRLEASYEKSKQDLHRTALAFVYRKKQHDNDVETMAMFSDLTANLSINEADRNRAPTAMIKENVYDDDGKPVILCMGEESYVLVHTGGAANEVHFVKYMPSLPQKRKACTNQSNGTGKKSARTRHQINHQQNMCALKQIFGNEDEHMLSDMLHNNGGNLQTTVEQLLSTGGNSGDIESGRGGPVGHSSGDGGRRVTIDQPLMKPSNTSHKRLPPLPRRKTDVGNLARSIDELDFSDFDTGDSSEMERSTNNSGIRNGPQRSDCSRRGGAKNYTKPLDFVLSARDKLPYSRPGLPESECDKIPPPLPKCTAQNAGGNGGAVSHGLIAGTEEDRRRRGNRLRRGGAKNYTEPPDYLLSESDKVPYSGPQKKK